jgi:hypothetical protein
MRVMVAASMLDAPSWLVLVASATTVTLLRELAMLLG